MDKKPLEKGIVLVATKEHYLNMAQRVVSGLLKLENTSELGIEIFVSNDLLALAQNLWDSKISIRLLDNPTFSFFDKIKAISSSRFDKLIYLDTDIVYMRSISKDIFSALDHVDLCVQFGMSFNMKWEIESYPIAISQPNTGVIGLNKHSSFSQKFLEKWSLIGKQRQAPHDQPAFRAAIIESGIKTSNLGPDYNFHGTNFLLYPPKIYHFTGGLNHSRIFNNEFIKSAILPIEEAFKSPDTEELLVVKWQVLARYSRKIQDWTIGI